MSKETKRMELMERLVEADYTEVLDTEVRKAYLDSMLNSSFQGWRSYLVFDEDGFSMTGVMSQGSMTMGMYEGTQLTLASIEAWREIETVVTSDVFDSLEDREEFIDYLASELEDEYTREELEGYHYTINYDGYYNDFNSDGYNKLIEEYAEAEWEAYGRDQIAEEIYLKIEEYKTILG